MKKKCTTSQNAQRSHERKRSECDLVGEMREGKQQAPAIMSQMPSDLCGPVKHPSGWAVHVILTEATASWGRRFPPRPSEPRGPFAISEVSPAGWGHPSHAGRSKVSVDTRRVTRDEGGPWFSLLTSVLVLISACRLNSLPESHKASRTLELVHDIRYAHTHWPTHCTRSIGRLWTISRAISPPPAPPGLGGKFDRDSVPEEEHC